MPKQMLSELEIYKWAIAKAETECPYVGYGKVGHKAFWTDAEGLAIDPCHGTGRVPRFPELQTLQREHGDCTVLARFNQGVCDALPMYGDCHGLGFVPLEGRFEDLATWQRVLTAAIGKLPQTYHRYNWWARIEDGDIPGAFKAATEALGIEVHQEETP